MKSSGLGWGSCTMSWAMIHQSGKATTVVTRLSSVPSPATFGFARSSTGYDVRAASAAAWRCFRRRRRRRRSLGHWHSVPTKTTAFNSRRTHPTASASPNDTVTSSSLPSLFASPLSMTSASRWRSCDFRSRPPTADKAVSKGPSPPSQSRSIDAGVEGSVIGDAKGEVCGVRPGVDGGWSVDRRSARTRGWLRRRGMRSFHNAILCLLKWCSGRVVAPTAPAISITPASHWVIVCNCSRLMNGSEIIAAGQELFGLILPCEPISSRTKKLQSSYYKL